MFPRAFRTQRALGALNVVGVGLGLASMTGLVLAQIRHKGMPLGLMSFVVTTAIVGAATAASLRWRRTVGGGQLRWGWVLSFFAAWLNGFLGLTAFETMQRERLPAPGELVSAVLSTATLGAVVWVPAWAISLVLFGLPIAKAQRLARQGLAGEERGERIIGVTVSVLSAVALLNTVVSRDAHHAWSMVSPVAVPGLLLGLVATAGAWQRERQRRMLVAAAEEGRAPGYRVESTDEGKVLVRVARPDAEPGYRMPDTIDEEFYALDEQGLAVQRQQP